MSDLHRAAWAGVKENSKFICVQTYSGYRSVRADPDGTQFILSPDVSDEELGAAVIAALSVSRFVLAEPREGVWVHPDASFDKNLYDRSLIEQRYEAWVASLMERYSYKSRRALFKGMKSCNIESKLGFLEISPSVHEKIEGWRGMPAEECVVLPSDSLNVVVGAGVRLALSRCR